MLGALFFQTQNLRFFFKRKCIQVTLEAGINLLVVEAPVKISVAVPENV